MSAQTEHVVCQTGVSKIAHLSTFTDVFYFYKQRIYKVIMHSVCSLIQRALKVVWPYHIDKFCKRKRAPHVTHAVLLLWVIYQVQLMCHQEPTHSLTVSSTADVVAWWSSG